MFGDEGQDVNLYRRVHGIKAKEYALELIDSGWLGDADESLILLKLLTDHLHNLTRGNPSTVAVEFYEAINEIVKKRYAHNIDRLLAEIVDWIDRLEYGNTAHRDAILFPENGDEQDSLETVNTFTLTKKVEEELNASLLGMSRFGERGGTPPWVSGDDDSYVPSINPDLDDLLSRFSEAPAPASLCKVLSRAFYGYGKLSFPAYLINRHQNLCHEMSPSQTLLVQRILGMHNLAESDLNIPDRSIGPAYQVERNRILYCAHSTIEYQSNGYSTRTHGVACGMRDSGTDVVVLARPGYPWDSIKTGRVPNSATRVSRSIDGIEYVSIPGPHLEDNPAKHHVMLVADAIVREARRQRVSVIQAASNYRTALPALIAARRLGVPFVYEVRGLWEITGVSSNPNWSNTERFALDVAMESLVATSADRVFAITKELAAELTRRGVSRGRIALTPNAADIVPSDTSSADNPVLAQLGIPTDEVIIGFAGSIVEYEGLHLLIDAAKILDGKGAHFRIVIAGDGKSLAKLRLMVSEYGLGNRVQFLGRIPNRDVPKLLPAFDIAVCPRESLPVTEMVSPLKPLEAMGAGCAVVLSDVNPHLDIAGVGERRARTFPSGDIVALAKVLEQLIETPEERRRLARSAQSWVARKRSWKIIGGLMSHGHSEAARVHQGEVSIEKSKHLAELRVGVVADRFTFETLSMAVQTELLRRETWRQQMDATRFDVIFIESAWEADEKKWFRGVGYYSPEEFADLQGILDRAEQQGIPTAFWNKEDPIHFARFRKTAAQCQHVFTTDANKLQEYLTSPGNKTRTVSSVSFFAEPMIQNPLPGKRPYEHLISYAGTYYGKRFAARGEDLDMMLREAEKEGVVIYDRHYSNPESPYRFPDYLQSAVRGSLRYDEVLDAYKAHPIHLNVNSVWDSPTMFSRRVAEIASSGAVAISGRGRGVEEVLGGAVPVCIDAADQRAFLSYFMSDEDARRQQARLQLRTIYRAHTASRALTIMFRSMGLQITAPQLPGYALRVGTMSLQESFLLLRQTHLPEAVIGRFEPETEQWLNVQGIAAFNEGIEWSSLKLAGIEWVGIWNGTSMRTYYEELLQATFYGEWSRIVDGRAESYPEARTPVAVASIKGTDDGLVNIGRLDSSDSWESALVREREHGLVLLNLREEEPDIVQVDPAPFKDSILLVGITPDLAAEVGLAGYQIAEPEADRALDVYFRKEELAQYRVIWCDVRSPLAAWYSTNIDDNQFLVLYLPTESHVANRMLFINFDNVDMAVCATPSVMGFIVDRGYLPRIRCCLSPVRIDQSLNSVEKAPSSQFSVCIDFGNNPEFNCCDIEQFIDSIAAHDSRYQFQIINKSGDELGEQSGHRSRISYLSPGRPIRLRDIGIVLSLSFNPDRFAERAAVAGTVVVAPGWEDAESVLPAEWIVEDLDDAVEVILSLGDTLKFQKACEETVEVARQLYCRDIFDTSVGRSLLIEVGAAGANTKTLDIGGESGDMTP